MWKILFYTMAGYKNVEKKLCVFEEDGYRVDRVMLNYFFHFKKAPPKRTSYFLTHHFLKEYDLQYLEKELSQNYNANPVCCSYSRVNLWRICSQFEKKEQFEEARRKYFIHVVTQELILIGFFLICFILSFVALYFQGTTCIKSLFCSIGLFVSSMCFTCKIIEKVVIKNNIEK